MEMLCCSTPNPPFYLPVEPYAGPGLPPLPLNAPLAGPKHCGPGKTPSPKSRRTLRPLAAAESPLGLPTGDQQAVELLGYLAWARHLILRYVGCILIFVVVALTALGFSSRWLQLADALLLYSFVALVLVLTCVFNVGSILDIEHLPANKAALRLFRYWERHPARAAKALPAKLRGVFWMSDQTSAQLLACFESMEVDHTRHRTTLWAAARYNWSFCDTRDGWLLYFGMRLLGVHALVFEWDVKWENAQIKLWPLGFLPPIIVAPFAKMSIKQLDREGDSWAVDVFVPGWAPRASNQASFTLVKVIDMDGSELPGFGTMMRTLKEEHKIKETTVKCMNQFVPVN
jgi:hypothetical protein